MGLGTIVRVPLRGRRVRGWVLGTCLAEILPEGLMDLAGISGSAAVFDAPLLAMARVLARHYVHPLATFLHLLTPPQMGRAMGRRAVLAGGSQPAAGEPPGGGSGESPDRAGPGKVAPTLRRLAPREDAVELYVAHIERVMRAGLGAIVVVPEVREGSLVLERLQAAFPDDVALVHSGLGPAERSKALWSVARGKRRVVVGGRAAALAPCLPLGLVVVHDEAQRTLKEQRSPYYDAREVAEIRASCCGAQLLVASEGPTLRSLQRARSRQWTLSEPSRAAMRATWPLVELLEPTRNVMPRRGVAAILGAARAGSPVLVLVPRLQATPAGPGPAEVAAYVRRAAPGLSVERADPGALDGPADLERALRGAIVIATEGALADVERPAIHTALALGVDAMIHRPTGRAAEEAFATLWELGCLVARTGPRGRLLLETDTPGHHAVQAVVRGDYDFFARHELEERQESASPPFATLFRVRASGAGMPEQVVERLAALPGTEVLGPVDARLGAEVLLKVWGPEEVLDPLREIVAGAGQRLVVEREPRQW